MPIQVNLRVSDEMRAQLIAAAEARGVSVNKEINDRLARSFDAAPFGTGDAGLTGLLTIIAAAMSAAGQAAGSIATLSPESAKQWFDNPVAFEPAMKAAIHVLQEAAPVAEQSTALPGYLASIIEPLGVAFANKILKEAATGNSQASGIAERERAKALNAAVGESLAARFKAGEPRFPIVLHSFGANVVLQTHSDPIDQSKLGDEQ